METVLSIQAISKRYGRIHAVNQLSIEIHSGQVYGLLGPNGSGKTTTLSTILGLIRMDSGYFSWFGEDPTDKSRKRIGSVIESPNFYPYLSPLQNLRIIADIKDKSPADIDRVLKLVDLFHRKNDKFRTFSFGMKQRLAIASAMLGNPEVLILDEPTNGLDPQGIAQIRELILMIAKEGITIILASHLLDEVQKICTHVAVLDKGKKLYDGNVGEVLSISDSFELGCTDMEKLEKLLKTHPQILTLTPAQEKFVVTFKGKIDAAELNDFFYRQGIILNHLAERKKNAGTTFPETITSKPMIKLIRIEFKKILTYKTFWIILGLYFLFLALGIILSEVIINSWVNEMNHKLPIPLPHVNIYFFPNIWQNITFFASIRYILIFPAIIIIILITNEFTYKTIRQNVVTGMSKNEFLLSKLQFILVLSLFITIVLKLVIFILGISHSEVTSFSQVLTKSSFIPGFFVLLFSFLIIAFFFGFVFRNTGLAIALFTLYVLVIEPVISMVSKIPSLHVTKLSRFLPVNSTLNVIEYPYFPTLKTFMGLKIQEGVSLMDCSIPMLYSAVLIGIVFVVMNKKDL